VTGAGPIFHDVMLAAVERVRGAIPIDDITPIQAPTADLHEVEICARSGLAAGDACPSRATEWLPVGAALAPCDWHFGSDEGVVTIWPEVYRDWARRAGYAARATRATPPTLTRRADADRDHATGARAAALTIASPLAGATFLIDPTLRPEFQALPLRAMGATGPLRWTIDDAPFAGERWPLVRGTHTISVKDAAGSRASVSVTVK
jgi:membrane carboxypeptidase/penicillin-binding protein PbpC